MSLKPGWVDEIAKQKKVVATTKVKSVDTDPPLWEHLRMHGKKIVRISSAKFAEARRRGGLKGNTASVLAAKAAKREAKKAQQG